MGYLDKLKKKATVTAGAETETDDLAGLDLDGSDELVAVIDEPPAPQAPEVTPEADPDITILRCPEMFRPAYISAGRIITHSEIVMIDGNGYAYAKTVPAVTHLRMKRFELVREAQHVVSG